MKSNMLKKFRIWESEVKTVETQSSIVDKVKSAIGEKVYVIPNFKQISKEGEPVQDVTLCTLQSGHSFALNFAGKQLYSVDFWLPDSTKSIGTLYVADAGLSVEELIKGLPALVKNPMEEMVEELDEKFKAAPVKKKKLVLKTAAPSNDVTPITDPGAIQVQADIKKAVTAPEDEEYKYGDKDTIFDDFRRYVRMVIKGVQPAFLCSGQPGIGKTYLTKDEIKKANLPEGEWVKITGKTSAPSLYLSLYKHNGKLLVYDDCDGFFDDEDAINTLKGALDSDPDNRTITWGVAKTLKDPETKEIVPTSFKFTGRVIFLSNRAMKTLKKLGAVKSRSFTLELALSPADMLAYIEEMLPKIEPNKSMAIKKMAMNTIKSVGKLNKGVQLNMRTLLKAVVILEEVEDLVVAKRMIVQQCSN